MSVDYSVCIIFKRRLHIASLFTIFQTNGISQGTKICNNIYKTYKGLVSHALLLSYSIQQ